MFLNFGLECSMNPELKSVYIFQSYHKNKDGTVSTVRRSALHSLCDRNSVRPSVRLSVRPSVCLSHSCTVFTWFDLRS